MGIFRGKNSLWFLVLLLFLIVGGAYYNGLSKQEDKVISGDGKGYYAYLPATFIYQDFDYDFADYYEAKYYGNKDFDHFAKTINGNRVNKYNSGLAVLQLPFFLLGHGFALVSDYSADGYSPPYQFVVVASSIFYTWLGAWFLFLLLRRYEIDSKLSLIVVYCFLLGTNLFYFSVGDASYTHAYNFAFIAAFGYFIRGLKEDSRIRYFLLAGLLYGVIIHLRAVNALVIFTVPFLLENFYTLKARIKKLVTASVFWKTLLVFFAAIFPQLIFWKLDFGSFFVYPYGNEGFDFSSPNFYGVLFSYRKGLFLYTPMVFLSLTGFYFLFKNKGAYTGFCLLGFFFLITYVFASWWSWWYGSSLGMRPFIDFYPFFAILLGLAFKGLRKKYLRVILGLLCFGALVLNQIQSYQYEHYILHWHDMDKEKYWEIFLKTGEEYEGKVWDK